MYKKEAEEFSNIVKRFKVLQDDDVIEDYDLIKRSLVLYDRFSYIKNRWYHLLLVSSVL